MRLLLTILLLMFGHAVLAQYSVPISDTCGRFGIACYHSGSPQNSMLQTIYLVNKQDKSKLVSWLKSNIPENQVHGYIGLFLCKKMDLC